MLETVEIETGPRPSGTVLWLHGLGADGHDFPPLVPQLVRSDERPLRFIFPHAPIRAVTINGGLAMRAWYDILGLDRELPQDELGIRATDAEVRELIHRENARGIPANRIVLGGFSQGGAICLFTGLRYPDKLAGLMGLSCYMPLEETLPAERTLANETTPLFIAHGTQDPMVDIRLGARTKQLLEGAGHPIEWHAYPMPHSICPQEVDDIAAWLRKVL